jgi:hypothetical protein
MFRWLFPFGKKSRIVYFLEVAASRGPLRQQLPRASSNEFCAFCFLGATMRPKTISVRGMLLRLVERLDREDLPRFIGILHETVTRAQLRLANPPALPPDKLLAINQVAKRMHVSKDFVYRRGRKFPFCRPQARKLLFSANGLDEYLRNSKSRLGRV